MLVESERRAVVDAQGLEGCAPPREPVVVAAAVAVLVERGVPLVVHSGTSSFPGSTNAYADPMHLDAVLRILDPGDTPLSLGELGMERGREIAELLLQSVEDAR